MAELAKQFVCVRVQSMNGVNLNLFQFERDLTWMSFFMDDRDRFYARYGGREDEQAESHLNKASLLRVMQQVLELHPGGKVQTSRYEPREEEVRTPEDIPTMRGMMARRKESKCIHCHDIKVAELRHRQSRGRFSRDQVFTYPTPVAVGLQIDPKAQNRVASVTAASPAAKAGVRPGDVIASVDGQRILTLADFARVLELTPKEAKLPLELQRGDRQVSATLRLSGDWRRSKDPSWRESLHVAGPNAGLWGMKLTAQERKQLGISAEGLAVRVTFIWADHTREAGVKMGDVIVAIDGLRRDMTIQQLHAHLNLNRNYGDAITVVVRRGEREQELKMQFPKESPREE